MSEENIVGYKTASVLNRLKQDEENEEKEIGIVDKIISKEKEKTEAFKKILKKELYEINELSSILEDISDRLRKIKRLQRTEEGYITSAIKQAENKEHKKMNNDKNKAQKLNKEIEKLLFYNKEGLDVIFGIETKTKVEGNLTQEIQKEIITNADALLKETHYLLQKHKQRELSIDNIRMKIGY